MRRYTPKNLPFWGAVTYVHKGVLCAVAVVAVRDLLIVQHFLGLTYLSLFSPLAPMRNKMAVKMLSVDGRAPVHPRQSCRLSAVCTPTKDTSPPSCNDYAFQAAYSTTLVRRPMPPTHALGRQRAERADGNDMRWLLGVVWVGTGAGGKRTVRKRK